jgi:hypothetical protein
VIDGFLTLTRFETRTLSRRTNRTAESMYASYADPSRKQRRSARQDGGDGTNDEGTQSREPGDTQPR